MRRVALQVIIDFVVRDAIRPTLGSAEIGFAAFCSKVRADAGEPTVLARSMC
ncbi:MAG: hypothetical protein QM323_11120 [Acidobacteriota bacterium]|nr:hypothetical protein [Acidobacteriota bacterium]